MEKYIESNYLDRDKLLKIPAERLENLRLLLNELEKKGKLNDKSRKILITHFLRDYFDDLIETFYYLKNKNL